MDGEEALMKDKIKMVKDCYDQNAAGEWERLIRHPVEYNITCRYIDHYIKPGDRILDIGGGPGRYSLYLAGKGCDVTLLDLSGANIAFAKERAAEQGLQIKTVCGDARVADILLSGQYDHLLLMGPLYHLPEEVDRIKTVDTALNLLKTGGLLYSAFISSFAAAWDYLARAPGAILDREQEIYFTRMSKDEDFSGLSFTQTHFIRPKGVDAFMGQFPLEKLHLVGCESILALREQELLQESPEVFQKWIDFAAELCERDDFISMAHHLLYIGRKL
jgi:2-polyprenyl-3-methyl-5-hydroxy-6-metoxy-1,4-benzoquinol methylase